MGVPNAKYCGVPCATNGRKKIVTYLCQVCQKKRTTTPAHIKNGEGKYCSRFCKNIGTRIPIEKRFWNRFDKPNGSTGCWIWTGNCPDGRYGKVKIDGKSVNVHIVAFRLTHGPIQKGQHVLHKCDTASCGNPAHLFVGTPQDNRNDMIQKRRYGFGEKHGMAKLTEQDVKNIRITWNAAPKKFGLLSVLGRQYRVSHSTIDRIVKNESWNFQLSHDVKGHIQEQAICDAKKVHANERNGRMKLTNSQIVEIRQRHQQGIGASVLARQFNVTTAHVHYVIRGEARSLP